MVDRKDGPNRPLSDEDFEDRAERVHDAATHYPELDIGTLAEDVACRYLETQERTSATDEVQPTIFPNALLAQLLWIVPLAVTILCIALRLIGVIDFPAEN